MSKKFTAFLLSFIAIMVGPLYVPVEMASYYYGGIATIGAFYSGAQGVVDTWGKGNKG